MASYPIAFYVEKEPKVKPESVQELLNAICDSLGTKLDSSVDTTGMIFGQLGGILPGSNIGPWSNGSAWWFFEGQKGYVQGLDGVPIGIMMIWGGEGTPANWLICDGSEVDRNTYQDLFQATGSGTIWGAGDGITTFNLPPGGVAYINAPGFVPDPLVILAPNAPAGMPGAVSQRSSAPSGLACIGGSQLGPLLIAGNLPPMQLLVPWIYVQKQQGNTDIGFPAPYSDTTAPSFLYQVQNNESAQLNELAADQSQFPVMPPFATANYIIKYR